MQEASKFLGHTAIETPGGGSLIAALAILPIGNFATVFSTVYWQLVFGKIFVGIGTGTCSIGGVRYLASYFSGERLQVLQGDYGGWLTGGNYRLSFTALEIFSLALALPVSGFACYESRRLAEPGGENVEKWLALTARWELADCSETATGVWLRENPPAALPSRAATGVFLAVSRAWRPSRQESRVGSDSLDVKLIPRCLDAAWENM